MISAFLDVLNILPDLSLNAVCSYKKKESVDVPPLREALKKWTNLRQFFIIFDKIMDLIVYHLWL